MVFYHTNRSKLRSCCPMRSSIDPVRKHTPINPQVLLIEMVVNKLHFKRSCQRERRVPLFDDPRLNNFIKIFGQNYCVLVCNKSENINSFISHYEFVFPVVIRCFTNALRDQWEYLIQFLKLLCIFVFQIFEFDLLLECILAVKLPKLIKLKLWLLAPKVKKWHVNYFIFEFWESIVIKQKLFCETCVGESALLDNKVIKFVTNDVEF